MPADFISVSEETGHIVPIGRWVLRTACRQGRARQQLAGHHDLTISVNLSARQIQHPTLAADVLDAIATSGLAPSTLMVEITESALLQDTASTAATLQKLRDGGVRVAIDDFGTGYSSLGYLQRFPIDVLKIDRSFVEGATLGTGTLVLAKAIVDIGAALGLQVVAEGIETIGQMETLRSFGCDRGQGYLFSEAIDAADVEALLASTVPPGWTSSPEADSLPFDDRGARAQRTAAPIGSAGAAPVMIATASVMVWLLGVTMAARRPRRWMWMRSATSNTCGMLWLIRSTARPRSRTSRMSCRTRADSRTPSAAVGSSRITTRLPNAAARATATPCRCPPDRVSTAWLMLLMVSSPRSESFWRACSRISP